MYLNRSLRRATNNLINLINYINNLFFRYVPFDIFERNYGKRHIQKIIFILIHLKILNDNISEWWCQVDSIDKRTIIVLYTLYVRKYQINDWIYDKILKKISDIVRIHTYIGFNVQSIIFIKLFGNRYVSDSPNDRCQKFSQDTFICL